MAEDFSPQELPGPTGGPRSPRDFIPEDETPRGVGVVPRADFIPETGMVPRPPAVELPEAVPEPRGAAPAGKDDFVPGVPLPDQAEVDRSLVALLERPAGEPPAAEEDREARTDPTGPTDPTEPSEPPEPAARASVAGEPLPSLVLGYDAQGRPLGIIGQGADGRPLIGLLEDAGAKGGSSPEEEKEAEDGPDGTAATRTEELAEAEDLTRPVKRASHKKKKD